MPQGHARARGRECSAAGPSLPLFSKPTGLADGLAPKERRYELLRARFAPEDSPESPTGSPAPTGAAGGIRQAYVAAEYKHRSRRIAPPGVALGYFVPRLFR